MALGGSPRCRHDALVNDAGLVSTVADGVPGYEIWAGGSLGKAPSLAVLLHPFVPRTDVLAAVEALVDVFVAHGRFDEPAKGRMKFVVDDLGADALPGRLAGGVRRRPRIARTRRCPASRCSPTPTGSRSCADVPPGGWSAGVRPQRTPGLASVTIDLPLGDTCSSEMDLCCDLADRHADGHLTFTRDQNIAFRNVPLAGVAPIRAALAERGVHLLGEGADRPDPGLHRSVRVRARDHRLARSRAGAWPGTPALRRNSSLRVFVSGCPNSCAQHQIGDIGLAGSKVRVDGRTTDGYQVYLGADLDEHEIGEVVGRVADDDLDAAVSAIVGTWEALRHPGESLGRTVRRFTAEAFSQQIAAALADRWAAGPEPVPESSVLVS